MPPPTAPRMPVAESVAALTRELKDALVGAQPARREERWLYWVLLAFAFSVPLSVGLSDVLIYLVALPLWVYLLIRGEPRAVLHNPQLWPLLAFCLVAVMASALGAHPRQSLLDCQRLLMFAAILMIGETFRTGRRASASPIVLLVVLFVAGSSLLAVRDIVKITVLHAPGVPLHYRGDVRRAQFFLVAMCFLLAMTLPVRWRPRRPWLGLALAINAAAVVLHFKRSVWLALLLSAAMMLWLSGRRKLVLALAAASVLAVVVVPAARHRLEPLWSGWSATNPESPGTRWLLWTSIAPVMIRDHPYGMGYRAVRIQDIERYVPDRVEHFHHMHNNILQTALELGWAGLAVWLAWMGWTAWLLASAWRRDADGDDGTAALALGGLGAFTALMLVGMVEANFGYNQTLKLFVLLMGLSSVLGQRGARAPARRP